MNISALKVIAFMLATWTARTAPCSGDGRAVIASILGLLAWLPVLAFPILFGLFLVVPFLLDTEPPAKPRPPSRPMPVVVEIAQRRAARVQQPGSVVSSSTRRSA